MESENPIHLQSNYNPDYIAERIIDITFILICSIVTVVLIISAYKTLRIKENRTLYNWLTVIFVVSTLVGRFNFFLS